MKKVSKFKQKGQVKSFRSELIDKIPSMTEDETSGLVITFHNYDGSTRPMACRTGFFTKRYGKKMTSGEIVMKINTFKHDFGAKYFTIQ